MLSTKNSYILSLVVLCTVLTLLLITYGNVIFDDIISIRGIGAAITLFTCFEFFSVWLIERKSTKMTPRKSVNLLLGLKTGKILMAFLFVAVYAFAINIELQRFLMVFIIIYLIYLFLNATYLTHREKVLKANRTNNSIIVKNES